MKDKHEFQVETTEKLGRFARAHRKSRGLTLETVSGLGNFSPRFLSEFERGKETAEIGKVLKALRVLPPALHRRRYPRLFTRRRRRCGCGFGVFGG